MKKGTFYTVTSKTNRSNDGVYREYTLPRGQVLRSMDGKIISRALENAGKKLRQSSGTSGLPTSKKTEPAA